MDLILWRSAEAEAENGSAEDLNRRLTPKGRRLADRAGGWLHQRLPSRIVLLSSPALRARQTAEALGTPAKTEKSLAPGSSPEQILRAAGWPAYKGLVVVVAHQPDLGGVLASVLSEGRGRWSVKK